MYLGGSHVEGSRKSITGESSKIVIRLIINNFNDRDTRSFKLILVVGIVHYYT